MPNCFQLTRKNETNPINLQDLDKELCEYECSDSWIGFKLAMGKSFQQIEEYIKEDIKTIPLDDAEGINFTENQ